MDEAYYYIHPRKGVPFAPLLMTLTNLSLRDVTQRSVASFSRSV
jgi:hypothetical protein